MLNQQPNRTSKLISDCFEDRGPLVHLGQKAMRDAGVNYTQVQQACVGYVFGE